MIRPITTQIFLPALCLCAAACLTPKTSVDGSDSGELGDGPGDVGEVSIYDVQTGEVETDSTVTLTDVVVTSPLTDEGGGFFVQDEGGGEYSGIYVYMYDEVELSPVVGDTVTLSGKVSEFYDATQITITSAADAYVTGSSTAVASLLEAEPDNWEAWESCLVTLEDQTVTSSVNTYGEVDLSIGIPMDNLFVNFTASEGDIISTVTGPITYSFEAYKINPRDQDDLVGVEVGGGGETTVAAIQSGEVATGAQVTLKGVISTSGLDRPEGGFFVQDAGGGEYSGVYIYLYEEVAADLSSLEAGQELTISGQVTEFYDYTEITVSSSADISVTGTGDVTVDVVSTPGDGDWEAWEGCLITVADVTVTSEEDDYGAMDLDNGLKLDDEVADYTASNGESFGTATGLLSYGYEYYRLNPRSQDDLDSDGTVPDPDPVDDATVSAIQGGDIEEGATVTVAVVVTSEVDLDEKGFFVQDIGGGEYSGVYVYRGSASAVSIGDMVEVTGVVTEYYGLTEIVVSDDADIVVTDPGEGIIATDAVSTTPSDWESWEGCLVTIFDVTVTSDDDGYGAVDLDNGLLLDDLLHSHGASDGDGFDEITGIITWAYSAWRINPRDGDI
jgi:predicted extracellular nuclease